MNAISSTENHEQTLPRSRHLVPNEHKAECCSFRNMMWLAAHCRSPSQQRSLPLRCMSTDGYQCNNGTLIATHIHAIHLCAERKPVSHCIGNSYMPHQCANRMQQPRVQHRLLFPFAQCASRTPDVHLAEALLAHGLVYEAVRVALHAQRRRRHRRHPDHRARQPPCTTGTASIVHMLKQHCHQPAP
jgi:hypothetical protein